MNRIPIFVSIALVVLMTALAARGQDKSDPKKADPTTSTGKVSATKDAWITLFDGKSLDQWTALKKGEFEDAGKVHVKDGHLVVEKGNSATGVVYQGKLPKINYELTFKARRTEGSDFFCGLTFPVEKQSLTLILGGWGGWVVGLSCIDGFYAIDNETCDSVEFKNNQWYAIKLRCTSKKVTVWIDGQQSIDFETEGRKLTVSDEMQACIPLGIATWNTTGEIKDLRIRTLSSGR